MDDLLAAGNPELFESLQKYRAETLVLASQDADRDRLLLHTCAFNARVFLEELHRIGEKTTALLFGPAVDRREGEDLSEQFASLLGGFVDWCDDVERVARGEPVAREAQAKPEPSAIAAVPRKVSDVQAAEVELRETLRNLRITTQSLVRLTGAYRKLRHELERYREDEAERPTVPANDDEASPLQRDCGGVYPCCGGAS